MSTIRCFVITPFILFWYRTLIRVAPGTAWIQVFKRILIDQTLGAPIVILLVFVSNAIFHQESWIELRQRIQDKGWITWIKGMQYWPFVHLINFGMLPLSYQPLFAHFASVYWNAVLSYYSNFPQDKPSN